METYDFYLIEIRDWIPSILKFYNSLEDLQLKAVGDFPNASHLIWLNPKTLESGKIYK